MISYTLAHTQFSSSKKLQLLPTLLGMTSINHENKHFLLQRKEYCTLICKESSADLQRFHWLVKQESKTASFRNHYQSNRIDSCGPHPQLRSPKYGKKKNICKEEAIAFGAPMLRASIGEFSRGAYFRMPLLDGKSRSVHRSPAEPGPL